MAAELDGRALIVAGAMSSDPERAAMSATAWGLARSYTSYEAMAREETARDDGIDFVIIATPNNLHVPVASAFLQASIHVLCDKPLAANLAQADELIAIAAHSHALFALTHNYTGYPAVKHARELVRSGVLGAIRKVLVEYHQDWLMEPIERENKQARWRTDPAQAGISCCVGDIGTHAVNLLEYITCDEVHSLCADLSTFVSGRLLDDDANILLRMKSKAKGVLMCSQIACGEENNLRIRIYGSNAGIEWNQQEPNTLILKPVNAPWRHLRTGHSYLSEAAKAAARLPPGHPEGYIEAFATLYRSVFNDIDRVSRGERPVGDYPTARDGRRCLQFVARAVESSAAGGRWVDL
jgi:predicted dehydrogenase